MGGALGGVLAGPARVDGHEAQIAHVQAQALGGQLQRGPGRSEHVDLVAAVAEEAGQLEGVALAAS